jgi:hypothetical protein
MNWLLAESQKYGILLFILFLSACTPAQPSPVFLSPTPLPAPISEVNADKSTLLDWHEGAAVYTFNYDLANLEAAHLCLWTTAGGYHLLAETGEEIRWFLDAVIIGDEQVVYVPYLRETDLAEIWLAGGKGDLLLVTSAQFLSLGEGYARAIPRQMAVVPGTALLLFNTTEFGYRTEVLNDLHLLDLETGALTTLLQPGEGGVLLFSQDGRQIAVQAAQGLLVLDPNNRSLQPAPDSFTPAEQAVSPSEDQSQPWHRDCIP